MGRPNRSQGYVVEQCKICTDPDLLAYVESGRQQRLSALAMERYTKSPQSGLSPTKDTTILRHLRRHFNGNAIVGTGSVKTAYPMPETALNADVYRPKGITTDIATLVQEQVAEKLRAGEARVTVQHGLQAQQLLDRREERKQDRQLAITIAKMLTGGEVPEGVVRLPEVLPPRNVTPDEADDVIEGVAVTVG